MPAKKKVTTAVAEEETAKVTKKATKKVADTKADAKETKEKKVTAAKAAKPAAEKKAAAEPAAEKKTAAKKTTEKKPAEKKATTKKTTAKKTTTKKAAAVKEEVAKKSFQEYKDVINWKKWEAHNMNWLYIEVNASDLMTELEAGVNNIETCANAILDCMLEGDHFIVEPKGDRIAPELTVRYYCDNLSEDRRKWADVQ